MSTHPQLFHPPTFTAGYGMNFQAPPPMDIATQLQIRIGVLENELARARCDIHSARETNRFLIESYSHHHTLVAQHKGPPPSKDAVDTLAKGLQDVQIDRDNTKVGYDALKQKYHRLKALSKLNGNDQQWQAPEASMQSQHERVSTLRTGNHLVPQAPVGGEEVDLLSGDDFTPFPAWNTSTTDTNKQEGEQVKTRGARKRFPSMYDDILPRVPSPIFSEHFKRCGQKDAELRRAVTEAQLVPLPARQATARPDSTTASVGRPAWLQHQRDYPQYSGPNNNEELLRPFRQPAWHGYAGRLYNGDAPHPPLSRPHPYTDLDAVKGREPRKIDVELNYGEFSGEESAGVKVKQSGHVALQRSSDKTEIEETEKTPPRTFAIPKSEEVAQVLVEKIQKLTTAQPSHPFGHIFDSKHAPQKRTFIQPPCPPFTFPPQTNVANTKTCTRAALPARSILAHPSVLDRKIVSYAESDTETLMAGSRPATPIHIEQDAGAQQEQPRLAGSVNASAEQSKGHNGVHMGDLMAGKYAEAEKSNVDEDGPTRGNKSSVLQHRGFSINMPLEAMATTGEAHENMTMPEKRSDDSAQPRSREPNGIAADAGYTLHLDEPNESAGLHSNTTSSSKVMTNAYALNSRGRFTPSIAPASATPSPTASVSASASAMNTSSELAPPKIKSSEGGRGIAITHSDGWKRNHDQAGGSTSDEDETHREDASGPPHKRRAVQTYDACKENNLNPSANDCGHAGGDARDEEDAARKFSFWHDLKADGEGRRIHSGIGIRRGLWNSRSGCGGDVGIVKGGEDKIGARGEVAWRGDGAGPGAGLDY